MPRRSHPGTLSAAAAALAFIAACTAPPAGPDFHSADSLARMGAIREAARTNDRSKVPDLIARLDSDDAGERLLAVRALERLTGTTQGYDYAAPRPEREAAIDRWMTWYAANRQGAPAGSAHQGG